MDVRSDAAQDVPISREHMDVRSDTHRNNTLFGSAARAAAPNLQQEYSLAVIAAQAAIQHFKPGHRLAPVWRN